MEIFWGWLIDRFQSLYIGFMVRPYERAVHIRRGKLKRICKPGYYWKLPFEVDEIHKVNVVSTTTNLNTQVVTAGDGRTYVVGVVMRWRVREETVDRLIIDLEDYQKVMTDTAYGAVAAEFFKTQGSPDIEELRLSIREAVRRRLGRFGIDIEDLFITDISPARTFRLVSGIA